jgi:hypothetical protein
MPEREFAEREDLKTLGLNFQLPSLDSLLLEPLQAELRNDSRLEQDTMLLTRYMHPRVLQLRMELRDGSLITTTQSNLGRVVVEFVERLNSPIFSRHWSHLWAYT